LFPLFATYVIDTDGNLPLLSTTPAVPEPPVLWTCEYFRKFSKKFEMTLTLFLEAWGKMIREKILNQKIS
jgi:hypothetical protein